MGWEIIKSWKKKKNSDQIGRARCSSSVWYWPPVWPEWSRWRNSKPGCLTGFSIQAMWADSLYFLCLLLTSICKILASFQDIWWSSSNACWANFDLSRRPFFKLSLCSRSLRTEVCLFRLHSFYHIRKECCICNVLWVGDHS